MVKQAESVLGRYRDSKHMFLTGIRCSVSLLGPKENVDTLNDDHSQFMSACFCPVAAE